MNYIFKILVHWLGLTVLSFTFNLNNILPLLIAHNLIFPLVLDMLLLFYLGSLISNVVAYFFSSKLRNMQII